MSKVENNIPVIHGFSKLNRRQRMELLKEFLEADDNLLNFIDSWQHPDPELQKAFAGFSENYITSYHLPMGVVPNMVVNGKSYIVPMVTEESSVIAAAARSAKFWAEHGGFRVDIVGTEKKGQIHFTWNEDKNLLINQFNTIKKRLLAVTDSITQKMRERGGGITAVRLLDKTSLLPGYFQIDVSFETADAMGANFINTCLEAMAKELERSIAPQGSLEIIMSILSNYTPDCLAKCTVECGIEQLSKWNGGVPPQAFARKFELANRIAQNDISRAVTHNKGIYNGVDAVILATGNDWRAVEASGHAYASSQGSYRALTETEISETQFRYTLKIPLALGTVGGLTKTHPLARLALQILKKPTAQELMAIAAAAGMANNFSAVSALITSGIQRGHMKMHLPNMLKQLQATKTETETAMNFFEKKEISYAAVKSFITRLRSENGK